MVHKSRHTNEVNDIPVDVEPMEVFFSNKFDAPIPRKVEAKLQKRQIKRKRRDTEKVDINPKRKSYGLCAEYIRKGGGVIYSSKEQ